MRASQTPNSDQPFVNVTIWKVENLLSDRALWRVETRSCAIIAVVRPLITIEYHRFLVPLDGYLLDALPQHWIRMNRFDEVDAIQSIQLADLDGDDAGDSPLGRHHQRDLPEMRAVLQVTHFLAGARVDRHCAGGDEVHAVTRLIDSHDHVVREEYLGLEQRDDARQQQERQVVEERYVLHELAAGMHADLLAHLRRQRVEDLVLAEVSMLKAIFVIRHDAMLGRVR